MKYQRFLFYTNFQKAWKASFILIIGLGLTIIASFYTQCDLERDAEKDMQFVCSDIQIKIEARLHAHAQLLRCGSALFGASDSVSREEWKFFYDQAHICKNIPGILGLGFSVIIPPNQLQQHIQHIRKQGFPKYRVKPVGERSVYTSVIYFEPFVGQNLRAFGYDMFSEPIRRKAMEISCDSNMAMLSGKVALVQETNKDKQAGTIMYVPVYGHNKLIATAEQRRAAIKGWVYGPYRMNDLMKGVLGRWDLEQQGRIHLQVYDCDHVSKESLLFDSQINDTLNHSDNPNRIVTIPVEFNGKKWMLLFTQSNEQISSFQSKVIIVFVGGLIISFLLFILSLSLFNIRSRAQQIAEQLTAELKEGKERFQTLLNSSAEAIYGIDMNGCCTFSNNACIHTLGYTSSEQLLGKNMHTQIHHSYADGSFFDVQDCKIYKAFRQGVGTHVDDEVFWRIDGTYFPAEYWSYPIFINGVVDGAVVSFFDITERKRAEEALRESEEKFRAIFENNSSAMAIIERDSTISMVNKEYCKMGKVEKTDVIGTSWIKQIPPDDLERLLEYNRKRLIDPASAPDQYEFSFYRTDGMIRDSLMSVAIIPSNKKIVCSFVDITERKQTEQALKESEERWKYALEGASNGVWDWNIETNKVYYSRHWKELVGLSGQTITDNLDEWSSRVYPDDLQGCLDALQLHIDGKTQSYSNVYRIKCQDDSFKWVLDQGKIMVYGENGKPLRMIGTITDITDRKKAEEALLQLSTRLSLATRAGGVGVWDYDLVNNILIWDDQMFALYGITKDSFGGAYQAWVDGLHPEDVARGNEEIKMALRGEKEFDTEFRVCWLDGSVHNIRAMAIVQRDDAGNALHMIGTNWDITEQKRAEEALVKSKQEADSANKAKSEFLANMSHEIRTPMNAILGFSEALYHKLESKQHKKMVKSIINGGNLLMSLLNDILDLSKIEADKLDILLQPVNFNNLLQEILLLFKEKAYLKGLELNYGIESEFPESVMMDEIRVKQVLFNLVGNAIKFTHKGYVEIKLSFTPTVEQMGQIQIEVEDTGIGIPESQYQIIFEAFRQQIGQSNREYGGTGLGLAITKRLVEKMNGSISVNSSVGRGSTFTVVFPQVEICYTNPRKTDDYEVFENIIFEKATILIVDDVATNIEAVQNQLLPSALTILTAENGELALEMLKYSTPDLVLLDMRMPGMDGYEVAKRINADPQKKRIPVIAYTASVLSSDKIENSEDFDGFLYKPVRRVDLLNQLKKFLKYTVDNQQFSSYDFDVSRKLVLENETIEKLPEIVKTLNEKFLPEWVTLIDTYVLFKIEAFANELKTFAYQYKLQILVDYANQIKEDLDMLNLENIRKNLYEFPEIIKTLTQLIKLE